MFKSRIAPLLLIFTPLSLAAEPVALDVRIIDHQTNEPVADARIIVNHGPAAEPSSAEMEQRNRQFQPKSLLVSKGSEVNFPNRDATQHHVYSFSPAKAFNLELFKDQPEAPVVFDETGVVEIGCNIHDQMQGFILITDSGLTARTDTSGRASVPLPADVTSITELSISVWHPRLSNVTETVNFTVGLPMSGPVELALDLTPEPEKTGRLNGLQKRFQDL